MPRAVSPLFGPELTAVRAARRWAEETIGSWGLQAHADTVVLVVSELATNAMVHARSAAQVTLDYDAAAASLDVAVEDAAPVDRPPAADGLDVGHRYVAERDPQRMDGGRGLLIVSSLAREWGLRETARGKELWLSLTMLPELDDPVRLAAVDRLLALHLTGTVLQDTVELARAVLQAEYAQASLRSLTEVVTGSAGGNDPVVAEYRRALTDLTLRTGLGLVPDAHGDPRLQAPISGIGGYLGVPVIVDGLAVGVLSVDQGSPRDWTPQDVAILRRLAHSAATELELRAVTADLALSATRLDVALRAAEVGGCEYNGETGELWWDERVVDMFGYDGATFTGRIDSFDARLHPEDRDRVHAAISDVLTQGGEMAQEYRIRLPNGVTRWISARGRRLIGDSGQVRLVGAVFDSTSMHLTRDRVARVIETMTDAYYSLDRDWRFTYVNNRAEALLGRTRGDLLGTVIWTEFPAAVGTALDTGYRQVMATGEPLTFEEHYPPPIDGRFELRTWATPDGISVVFHDVSERHRDQLERERSLADVRAAHSRLELLSAMTRALVSTLDVDEALARLLDLLVPHLGDWCTVTLADEGGQVHQCIGRHRDPGFEADVERITRLIGVVTGEDSTTSTVLRTRQPVLVNDTRPERLSDGWRGDELTQVLDQLQLRHLLAVPLSSRERVLGVITLCATADRPGFTQQDLATATEVGRLAGLAIDNAQLYDRQRSAAEMLQRHLLPPLPRVPGLQITARYVPAAQEAQVGGDFYWGAPAPGGGLTVAIGDVSGHDLAATSWQAQLAPLLRGLAFETPDGPAAVLSRADAAMRGLAIDTMATALLATLVPPARVPGSHGGADAGWGVTWASAGHLPPLLARTDGTVQVLTTEPELLLGLDTGAARSDHTCRLERGETFLLFTDGLVERRGSDLLDDVDRLGEVLGRLAGSTLDELADGLLGAMLGGSRPADDVALLAVRVGTAVAEAAQS